VIPHSFAVAVTNSALRLRLHCINPPLGNEKGPVATGQPVLSERNSTIEQQHEAAENQTVKVQIRQQTSLYRSIGAASAYAGYQDLLALDPAASGRYGTRTLVHTGHMCEYSRHVMQLKNSGSSYIIPFEMTFRYEHPQADQVIRAHEVRTEDTLTPVQTIEEAVELYVAVYRHQLTGDYAAARKANWLYRFLAYLKEQRHSLRLADLSYEDGKRFLDSLAHGYQGKAMSVFTKKRYKCALRSLSRFLVKTNLIEEDVFFALKVK
jgi:hypothetical protein